MIMSIFITKVNKRQPPKGKQQRNGTDRKGRKTADRKEEGKILEENEKE